VSLASVRPLDASVACLALLTQARDWGLGPCSVRDQAHVGRQAGRVASGRALALTPPAKERRVVADASNPPWTHPHTGVPCAVA